jgi:hypothetical protein
VLTCKIVFISSGGGPKGLSGMDDISAPSELERNLDLLLEARSKYEKKRSDKKEVSKLEDETKESAAQMIIEAGIRMKKKATANEDGENGELDADMPPSPATGRRGKDKVPRQTPKRKRDEEEEKESFQDSLLADLGSTKKFLQDFLTQSAEQDRKAAVEKKELIEKFARDKQEEEKKEDARIKESKESQKMIAMATLAMSKMIAIMDKKGLLDA